MQKKMQIPHFMIMPSENCPAACSYCFGPHQGETMSLFTLQEILNYIQKISDSTNTNKVMITFHGGEPLCAGFDFFKTALMQIDKQFIKYDIQIKIQSNLWLLDDKFCELFKTHQVAIGTSLDGPKEINDGQRGVGYFEKTMQGINLARSYGLKVGCIATLTARSAQAWQEVFDFFVSQKLNLSLHAAVPSLKQVSHSQHLSPEMYAAVLPEIFDYYIQHMKRIQLSTLDQMVRGVCLGQGDVCTFRDCVGMFIVFDPKGGIYSCQRMCGHVEHQLGTVSESLDYNVLMQGQAAQRLNFLQAQLKKACDQCQHKAYCNGGCLYNALAGQQSRDPYCKAYQSIFSFVQHHMAQTMIDDLQNHTSKKLKEPLQISTDSVFLLLDQNHHPSQTARHAKKIIAAVLLARHQSPLEIASFFKAQGWTDHTTPVENAVRDLQDDLQHFPRRMNNCYIHITDKCQLECTHCYASAGSADKLGDELPSDKIIHLIKQACQAGFRQCVVTGGEPFMYSAWDKLFERIEGIRQALQPLNLILRTNFVQPLESHERHLIAKAFDQIVVSVDGDQASHDQRRGAGSYQAMYENCKNYQKENARTVGAAQLSLAAVVEDDGKKEAVIQAVEQLAQRLSIKRTRIRPLLPLGRALGAKIDSVAKTLHHCMDFSTFLKEGVQMATNCGLGQNIYIDPRGFVYPCYAHYRSEDCLGSIFENGLQMILELPRFKAWQSVHVDQDETCQPCQYKYLCGGMCHAWDRSTTNCKELYTKAEKLYQTALTFMQGKKSAALVTH